MTRTSMSTTFWFSIPLQVGSTRRVRSSPVVDMASSERLQVREREIVVAMAQMVVPFLGNVLYPTGVEQFRMDI
jgi:hypothetical protein